MQSVLQQTPSSQWLDAQSPFTAHGVDGGHPLEQKPPQSKPLPHEHLCVVPSQCALFSQSPLIVHDVPTGHLSVQPDPHISEPLSHEHMWFESQL